MPAAIITNEVEKVLLATISTSGHAARNRLAFMLSLYSGMRAGEIAALKVGDVYGDNMAVKNEIHLTAEQTKGSKARRVILNKRLARELTTYAVTLNERTGQSHRALIASQKSGHFSSNAMVQLFNNLYKNKTTHKLSSHSGRRTFITRLAAKGVGARVLQELAGHKHLNTTQRYIDINDDMLHKATELL